MPTYRVVLTPAADRQLTKLPRQAREMIAAAIVALASNPRPAACAKLSGVNDLWPVRARAYRIIYKIIDDQLIVTVVKIRNRKDVYR